MVRRGLQDHVVARRIASVDFYGARVARRHAAGPLDLADQVAGLWVRAARRRGKYLWLELGPGSACLTASETGSVQAPAPSASTTDSVAMVIHLGMSGQLLVSARDLPAPRHLHALVRFEDSGPDLRFVDQRTFGGFGLAEVDAHGIPETIAGIAPDPFDPMYDEQAVVERIRRRHSAIKRVLLDQGVVSGIGNIYADEALWRAQVHGERMADSLTRPTIRRVLAAANEVMAEALGQGGTSFDALYVNVNGASGYFDRSLAVYGQQGRPCPRCGSMIVRQAFMNRSSHFCPRCQPRPRRRRA